MKYFRRKKTCSFTSLVATATATTEGLRFAKIRCFERLVSVSSRSRNHTSHLWRDHNYNKTCNKTYNKA